MVKSSKLITYGVVITVAIAGVYGLKRMLNSEAIKEESVEKPTTWKEMVGNPQDDAASMRLTGKSYDTVTLGGKGKRKRDSKKKRLSPKNKTINKKR